VQPMSSPTDFPYLAAMVYVAGEPVARHAAMEDIVQEVLGVLGDPEDLKLQGATAGGGVGAEQAFSMRTLCALLDQSDVGSLTIHGAKADRYTLELRLYVRHDPNVPLIYQAPGVWYLVAGGPRWPAEQLGDAAVVLLQSCAAELSVLHGGATLLWGREQALSEASLIAVDLARLPEEFVRRWCYDARSERLLGERARRVYWATLLGPRLAAAAGGVTAAQAQGAAQANEIRGSLVMCATSRIADSLSPEFPSHTQNLRRWLWPLLIQNPADAPDPL
jgi:hypothetical protein